ncbi:PTS galactitol transporter subunit IIC, partial [Listeria monocytogenes]|nr:PTS galactitol transporter subunit IIC [Listeria monocytogenes]
MDIILDFFKYIIGLGVTVMMPIIITILGVIFRKKISVAFKAGLTVGVGFVGLGVITSLMLTTITPVTKALVENYNFK